MDNKIVHIKYELPSTQKLLLSTGIAFGIAILVLVLFILPAEYGIDVTGVGKMTGLKNMGEIKKSLKEEQITSDTMVQEIPCDDNIQTKPAVEPIVKADTLKIILKPDEAAEIKLVMEKDAVVDYDWKVDTGHLNFDIHGDKPGIKYHGYRKGKRQKSDTGQLKAAFKGAHGWYWRNRSKEIVEITLVISGKYAAIKRVV